MAGRSPPFVQEVQRDHPAKTVEVWFQDEARVGQQGTLTNVWAERGSRPRAVKQTEYEWVYVLGAVNPLTGNSSALLSPTVNTEYMNAHLRFISEAAGHDAHVVLVLDRYAPERRKRRGENRPETFDFLGSTHKCARTRKHGWFAVHRHSVAKRMRATPEAIKAKLRKRIHRPFGETAKWLRRVVQGWLNYHAVPNNSHRIGRFVDEVTRHWLRALRSRSQRGRRRWRWSRMQRLVRRHLPRPRIVHPYPSQRFRDRLKAGAV